MVGRFTKVTNWATYMSRPSCFGNSISVISYLTRRMSLMLALMVRFLSSNRPNPNSILQTVYRPLTLINVEKEKRRGNKNKQKKITSHSTFDNNNVLYLPNMVFFFLGTLQFYKSLLTSLRWSFSFLLNSFIVHEFFISIRSSCYKLLFSYKKCSFVMLP
jgi:hypothetical protein